MSLVLFPSYPAPSYSELNRVLTALQGVSPGFQIDFVDGEFATPASWPLSEDNLSAEMARLVPWQSIYQFEFDLMVANPVDYFPRLSELKATRVVLHLDSLVDIESALTAAFSYAWRVDIAILNDTPRPIVDSVLADYPALGVQVMGIKEVGMQGQPFDPRTLTHVRELRAYYQELEITVDGAVNKDTIPLLYAAGANRFAPGSAITKATDPVLVYKQLLSYLV